MIGTGRTSGKTPHYWVEVSAPAGRSQRITLAGDDGVWSVVRPGDKVTLTSWRDQVVGVGDDKAFSTAWDDPDEKSDRDYGLLGIAALALLAPILWPAVHRLRQLHAARWLVPVWIGAVGVLFVLWPTNTKPTQYLILPATFAGVGLTAYPTLLVVRHLRLRAVDH